MEFYNFIQMIEEHVVLPVIIAFGAAVLLIFKHYFDKISKSIVAKNEISEMEKQASIRNELINTIEKQVKTAVASNMQTAKEMKKGGKKLNECQIQELNNSAMNIVIGYLPPSLTEEGGVLLDFIGGREKLNGLISAMIEKYVYEYQISELKLNTLNEEVLEEVHDDIIESQVENMNDNQFIEEESVQLEAESSDNQSTKRKRNIKKTPVLF